MKKRISNQIFSALEYSNSGRAEREEELIKIGKMSET